MSQVGLLNSTNAIFALREAKGYFGYINLKIRDEDQDPVIFALPDPVLFFHWIRILTVTTDLKNYFHLEQNIYQN